MQRHILFRKVRGKYCINVAYQQHHGLSCKKKEFMEKIRSIMFYVSQEKKNTVKCLKERGILGSC